MSVRRFLAYFFAVTAGSTVAFASFLSAPGAAMSETARQEATLQASPNPETVRLFQELEARHHRRAGVTHASVTVADNRLGE